MNLDLEMPNEQKKFSIVPQNYDKDKDPRALLYHYPSLPIVKYAKLMQVYMHNAMLQVAQEIADNLDYILVPARCMHWERVKKIGSGRRVRVGRHNFYLLKEKEMTKAEIRKLLLYMDQIND